MNLSFDRDNLFYVLQVLQGVASGRTTLPILSNILIRANDEEVECVATDLEVGINIKVAAVVNQPGAITVSAKKLSDIVRELPAGENLNMTTTANDRIKITCGKGVYTLIGLPEEEFPEIPTVEGDAVSINGDTLRGALYKTEYAASTEEVRYFLNGLYFNFLEDRTEIVSTDGKRLALSHFEPIDSENYPDNFIVPLKAIREIQRTFSESSDIKISALESQILFTDGVSTLTSRLVEGEYPNYSKIIPEQTENRVIIGKDDVLKATRRVALLSNPKNYGLAFEIGQDQIRVFAKTPDLGEAFEDVNIESVEDGGAEMSIGFDARLIEQAISHIETDKLALEFTSPLAPVLVRPVGAGNQLSLVMPMRLDAAEESGSDQDADADQDEATVPDKIDSVEVTVNPTGE